MTLAEPGWKDWSLDWKVGPPLARQEISEDHAALTVNVSGMAVIDRSAQATTLILAAPPTPEAMVHPHLGATAIMHAHWTGGTSFHAGAFLWHDGVWGVLGDRERGKSSTLAWLQAQDVGIVSDDLVVLDGPDVLAGPRCLDLREGAAKRFSLGDFVAGAGDRDRWRVRLDAVPSRAPLRGWIDLRWGDAIAVEPVEVRQRFAQLAPHRGLRVVEPPAVAWMHAVTQPMFTFTRPRSWSRLDSGMRRLLEALPT